MNLGVTIQTDVLLSVITYFIVHLLESSLARICHEKSATQDECFGPEKAKPALVRRNLITR